MCSLLSKIRAIYLLVFLTRITLIHCVTLNIQHSDITAKSKIELAPLKIPCYLNDIIRLSAPMINAKSLYYLRKPNGELNKLDLNTMQSENRTRNGEIPNVVALFRKNYNKPIITQSDNFGIFTLKFSIEINEMKFRETDENEFLIGPLTEEDSGKWVLSMYTKDFNDEWIELFKVITVSISVKTKIELEPVVIQSFLSYYIRLSAPMINSQSLYYLYKPNGESIKLDLRTIKQEKRTKNHEIPNVVAFYRKNYTKTIITQSKNFDVFSVHNSKEILEERIKEMDENEFLIGPLTEEDAGNWVLSIYTKDFNDEWIELFKVITVLITVNVPITPESPILKLGETFHLKFAYSIPDLETCELKAPRSTFDRLFDRNRIDMNRCSFTVPNVTDLDSGLWRIVGVGKIIYEGEVLLSIKHNYSSNSI